MTNLGEVLSDCFARVRERSTDNILSLLFDWFGQFVYLNKVRIILIGTIMRTVSSFVSSFDDRVSRFFIFILVERVSAFLKFLWFLYKFAILKQPLINHFSSFPQLTKP